MSQTKTTRRRRFFQLTVLAVSLILALWGFFVRPLSFAKASLSPIDANGVRITETNPAALSFTQGEEPTFVLKAGGLSKPKGDLVSSGKLELENSTITAGLNFNDQESKIVPEISAAKNNGSQFLVKVGNSSQFRPGKYELKVDVASGSDTQTLTQDFTWGVLALNLDQSSYMVGENAQIGMAVLNDLGETLCDAELELKIENRELGTEEIFSTENGKIEVNPECEDKSVTNLPDYFARYQAGAEGEYQLLLKAETANGLRTLNESFKVLANPDYVIKRYDTSIRIYPPSIYTVNINVLANKDLSGGIKEKVPASFSISNISAGGQIISADDVSQIISWPVGLKAGENVKLSYEYDAPDTSPQFYLLGPLEIWQLAINIDGDQEGAVNQTTIFTEPRSWQIASDAPSQVVDGTSTYGTAYSSERKVVRTNVGPNGNRVFVLSTASNIAMNLYYSDDAEAVSPTWTLVGDINADTSTSAPNWESSDMVWDSTNNCLYIAYGPITVADANTYDLLYRQITAVSTTPVIGTQRDAMSASTTLTYSHPTIAIAQDAGTTKIFVFASEHYNGAATRNIAMRTGAINSDNPFSADATRVLDTAWTANANSGLLGVTRMNTGKLVLAYYNGTNILATRHDDSVSAQNASGWDNLAGTDASRTTVSADDPGAPCAGSIVGDTDSDTAWFSWIDAAYDINTNRWNGSTLDGELVPVAWAGANWVVGPALSTNGTTLYMIYQKASDASILVYQSRTFSNGTSAWGGSETTIEDSTETSVTYPSVSRDMYDGVVDVVFTTTTNYYIRHAMININSLPTLTISQPDGTGDTIAENSSFNITYTLADSDNTVTVDFYYDSDGSGLDGTSIAACQDKVAGSGLICSWDTTGITPGSYYIYGITKDPSHTQVSAYSSGVVTINDKPELSISQPDGIGDTVTVGASYDITYTLIDTDDTVTVAMYYDSNNSGLDGTAITGACAGEGTDVTCSWNTTGMTLGSYYVYGLTSGDSINPQQNDYSPGMITINSANQAPNSPSGLAQKKVTGGATLATGDWTNETQVQFTATASDTDNPDTLYLCVEKDAITTALSSTNGGDLCGSGVAYSGTPVTVSVTITGLTDATEFHWQAQVKDTASAYSSFVGYGGNTENPPTDPAARDFGTDTTAPTGGIVNDGAGADTGYNDGSLSSLSANWSGVDSTASGLNKYEYAIGTTQGGVDTKAWTENGTGTTVTVGGLTLRTGQTYFFGVRTTDNATNVSTPMNSNGQAVAATLTFSYFSGGTITFDELNSGNSYTDSAKTTVLQTSTNAYGGYVVKARALDELRHTGNASYYIDHYAALNSSPTTWSGTGFGYTTSDSDLSGGTGNRFTSGGPKYAGWVETVPGDPVADHTANVTGSPISSEQFTITYRVTGSSTGPAGKYQTTIVYTCIPQY